jgi:tetratricopeptide (TPR) repeat protein
MRNPVLQAAEKACAAHRCEDAIELLERTIRQGPSSYKLHYMLGVCYAGGCRRHSLANPEMAVPYLRHALQLAGTRDRRARAAILDELGNALCAGSELPRDSVLRAAAACLAEAAQLYGAAGAPQQSARLHFNLGNTLCDLSEATGEDHWLDAVSHYQEALRIRTRERDPERHAAVLENLGTAYRRLSGENVGKCIRCYRQALRVYVAGKYPQKNAALQNNMGNAFLSLPQRDDAHAVHNARRALRHFDRALGIQSADKTSRAYGITQYNRAQAYLRLARVDPAGNLEVAIRCLEEAGAAFENSGDERYLQLIKTQLQGIGELVR